MRSRRGSPPRARSCVARPGDRSTRSTATSISRRSTAASTTMRAMFERVRGAAMGGAKLIFVATMHGELGRGGFGGPAGLIKTVAAEWPDVRARVVDLDPSRRRRGAAASRAPRRRSRTSRSATSPACARALEVIPAEIRDRRRRPRRELGRARHRRRARHHREGRDRARAALRLPHRAGRPLAAARPPRIRRSPAPHDARALRGVLAKLGGTPADIEARVARVLADREIRATLAALGDRAHATTRSTSARPRSATLIDELYAQHGRIDARDPRRRHPRGQADPPQDARVVRARVRDQARPARARSSSKLRDDVKLVVLFSSISGAFGNRGQVDYAAAGDALDKLAWPLQRKIAGRVVSIDWGPWAGTGMVSAELEREYAKRGIGLIDPERGVEALLAELGAARGDAQVILDRVRSARAVVARRARHELAMRDAVSRVAIVGMGAVFPGAPDLATFWRNLERRRRRDHATCRRRASIPRLAAAIGFTARAAASSTAPRSIRSRSASCRSPRRGAEPDQLLALAGRRGARSPTPAARSRAIAPRVILGRGGYLTPGMARLANRVRTAQQLVTTLAELLPDLDADDRRRRSARRSRRRPATSSREPSPRSASCRTSPRRGSRTASICAGPRTRRRRVRELAARGRSRLPRARRSPLRRWWSPAASTSVTTSRSGACSRSSARSAEAVADPPVRSPRRRHPDRRGRGIVVLKRLADAERDGDRIYAAIRGTGVSSDGRESERDAPARRRPARRDRRRVDARRARTRRRRARRGARHRDADRRRGRARGARRSSSAPATGARAALGSVKSMIGHAMPAAGAAGPDQDRARARITACCRRACTARSRTTALAQHAVPRAREGRAVGAQPTRVAGVSAFGFGGINAHVVLEPSRRRRQPLASRDGAADSTPSLARDRAAPRSTSCAPALDVGRAAAAGPMRLALLDPTPERLALAHKVLDRGKPWRGKSRHLVLAARARRRRRQARVRVPRRRGDVRARTSTTSRATLGIAAPPRSRPRSRRRSRAATPRDARAARRRRVRARPLARDRARARSASRPTRSPATASASGPAWSSSEMIPPADRRRVRRASCRPAALEVPDVVFAAVGCGAAGATGRARRARRRSRSRTTTARTRASCAAAAIACVIAIERLARARRAVPGAAVPLGLPLAAVRRLSRAAPHAPRRRSRCSGRACRCGRRRRARRIPTSPTAIRALAIDHLVAAGAVPRARRARCTRAACARSSSSASAAPAASSSDTLRGRDHLAIAAASHEAPGLSQLARVQAALFVEGFARRTHASRAAGAARARR